MAESNREEHPFPGSSSTPAVFAMSQQNPVFRPNAPIIQAYPTSLAFWNNPHILQPVSQPSNYPALQSQMPSVPQEPKKHKRTRSGCYTCRTRRIKCDETRPVCERCNKGNRDCAYPPPPQPKKGSQSNSGTGGRPTSIPESESEEDGRRHEGLTPRSVDDQRQQQDSLTSKAKGTIPRRRSAQTLAKKKSRQRIETSTSTKEASSSPSTTFTPLTGDTLSPEPSVDFSTMATQSPSYVLSDLAGVSNLAPDAQFFLAYRRQNINHRHYFLKYHAKKFIEEDILLHALEYEPLLYAVVGFAAYHYSIGQPDGKLYTFLQYYNRSVSLLLKSLQAGDSPTDAMLLTILQLIAFEEYLGDWVNLVDHHQAAHRMILDLYTPEDMRVNEFHRHMVMWYCRFDVMAGLMAGNDTVLGREWYTTFVSITFEDAANHPHDLDKKIWAWSTLNRQLAMDMASFCAKIFHKFIDADGLATENQQLMDSLEELNQSLESMGDPRYLVTSFPNKQPLGPEDVVDPYVPGLIYSGHLWEVNHCKVELEGAILMYKYQMSLLMQNSDLSEIRDLALGLCRLMETMYRFNDCSDDTLFPFRPMIGLMALFMRQDAEKMWCRRKFATLEQLGYIYPPTFRHKIADVWKIPEAAHWWLPNEEGYPNLVREIREWTNERTTNPRDASREAIRDMRLVFRNMDLDDTGSQTSSPSTQSGPYTETTPD